MRGRLRERALPARLGLPFRWLVGASWAANLADGVALAAGPLLVAAQTRDPALVSLAVVVQQLPGLLLGLYAGVVADRVDRRTMLVVSDLCRIAVVAVLATTIVTGSVSLWVVLGALLLLGIGETFADTGAGTLVPMLVAKRDLGVANARIMSGFVVGNQMIGPPIGAALFALGHVWPWVLQGLLLALGCVLLLRMRLPYGAQGGGSASGSVTADVLVGLRWVRHHAAVRTLVLTILVFNVTFGAAFSVLVLYALERLGLGEVGFGLLTTAMAAGGLLGTAVYTWLERRLPLGVIMRAGLLIETLTHLALALTTVPAVAFAVMFVFGAHAFVWGTTSQSVRQRAVPMQMQGRVNSVDRICSQGGFAVGALLGGGIASVAGVVAPFWFGFVGSAVFLVLLWRRLLDVAHADGATLAADPG